MKKVFALIVAALIILSAASAFSEETPAFRKFRRGVCNLATFHLEFVHQMKKEGDAGGDGRAMTIGLVKGLGMSAARLLTGVYELVSFPIPFPPEYKPIMTDPEFFWTEPFSESGAPKK